MEAQYEYDDNSEMPFGAHEGKPLGGINANYLLWLYQQIEDQEEPGPRASAHHWKRWGVKGYIEDMMDILENEVSTKS